MAMIVFGSFLFFKNTSKINRKILIFFGIWFLAASFLCKEGAEPFPQIFVWIFRNVPGFTAFRDAFKIALASILPWAFLFGFSVFCLVDLLISKFNLKKASKLVAQNIIFIFVILLIFGNLSFLLKDYPTIAGDSVVKYLSTFEPEEISTENLQMEKFIAEDPDKFRILYLPTDPAFGILNQKHTAIYSPEIDPSNSPLIRYLLGWRFYLKGPFFRDEIRLLGKLTALKNVKYIIYLPQSDIFYKTEANEERWASSRLLPLLKKQKDLERLNLGENIFIFLNKNFKRENSIFLTQDSYLINGGLNTFLPLAESPLDFNNTILFSVPYLKDGVLDGGLNIKKVINFQKDKEDLLISSLPSEYFLDPWPYANKVTLTSVKDENEEGFWQQNESRPTLVNYSGNIALGPHGLIQGQNGFLKFPISVKETKEYEVWMRFGVVDSLDLSLNPEITNLNSLFHFTINGYEITPEKFQLDQPNNLRWVKLFNYFFDNKENQFEMNYKGEDKSIVIDQLAIVSVLKMEEQLKMIDQFLSEKTVLDISQKVDSSTDEKIIQSIISRSNKTEVKNSNDINKEFVNSENLPIKVEKTNNTSYRLNFDIKKPTYLVFTDNYDPYWELTLNGKKYRSIRTMTEGNSFYIDKAGDYMGELEFIPQRYMDAGFYMSVASLICLLLIEVFLFLTTKENYAD